MQHNPIIERVRQQQLGDMRKRTLTDDSVSFLEQTSRIPIDRESFKRSINPEEYYSKISILTSSCNDAVTELHHEVTSMKTNFTDRLTDLEARMFKRDGDGLWKEIKKTQQDFNSQIERMDDVLELLCERMEELELVQEEIQKTNSMNEHRYVTHSELNAILECYNKRSLDTLSSELSSLNPDILSERMSFEYTK